MLSLIYQTGFRMKRISQHLTNVWTGSKVVARWKVTCSLAHAEISRGNLRIKINAD